MKKNYNNVSLFLAIGMIKREKQNIKEQGDIFITNGAVNEFHT
jgi:hypothetical protein